MRNTACLPNIAMLATGGTIAGQASNSTQATEYRPGVLDVGTLLAAIPALKEHATLHCEQLANIGSEDMSEEVWFALAKRINALGRDPAIDSIVVLHGTDTMEETAYFLNLVVKTAKPVVLTGAMRPANAVSADGPANILAAVRTAVSEQAAGLGVLIVFGNSILAARETTKLDTLSLDAFGSPGLGALGSVVDDSVCIYRSPTRLHTLATEFSLPDRKELPRVEIIYGHAGQQPGLAEAAVRLGSRGIVHAGVGAGNIHAAAKKALIAAAQQGIAVVCASRTGCGIVPCRKEAIARYGLIGADNLNPQKARVLLQLALTKTADPTEIQRMFEKY